MLTESFFPDILLGPNQDRYKTVQQKELPMQTKEDGRKNREKRPVFFYGLPAATKIETVQMDGDSWNAKDAEAKIKAKLGKDAIIIGPNYEVKGGNVKSKSGAITVKLDLRQMKFTKTKFVGEHEGWTLYGNGIAACEVNGEKYDDDDLIQVQIESLVNADERTPKPRLSRQVVRRDALDSVSAE